jgi:hypothetical protein
MHDRSEGPLNEQFGARRTEKECRALKRATFPPGVVTAINVALRGAVDVRRTSEFEIVDMKGQIQGHS